MDCGEFPKAKRQRKGGGIQCCMFGCTQKNIHTQPSNSRQLGFYRFPKEKDRCLQWKHLCARNDEVFDKKSAEELNKQCRICSLHFSDDQFNNPNSEPRRLKCNAIPNMNLPQKSDEGTKGPSLNSIDYVEDVKEAMDCVGSSKKKTKRKGGGTQCAVFGCTLKTIYAWGPQARQLNFYSFPKEKTRCLQWKQVCARSDEVFCSKSVKQLNLYSRICCLHFSAHQFHYRGVKFSLRRNAVPDKNLPNWIVLPYPGDEPLSEDIEPLPSEEHTDTATGHFKKEGSEENERKRDGNYPRPIRIYRGCSYPNCRHSEPVGVPKTVYDQVIFHAFPQDEKKCKLWIKKTGMREWVSNWKDMYHSARLCSNHFEDRFYSEFGPPGEYHQLIDGAYPTLFDDDKKVPQRCSVKNCSSVKGKCNLLFFDFPADEESSRLWRQNCGHMEPQILDMTATEARDFFTICSFHFDAQQFTNIRCKTLKPDAVPTIFPNNANQGIPQKTEDLMNAVLSSIKEIPAKDKKRPSQDVISSPIDHDELKSAPVDDVDDAAEDDNDEPASGDVQTEEDHSQILSLLEKFDQPCGGIEGWGTLKTQINKLLEENAKLKQNESISKNFSGSSTVDAKQKGLKEEIFENSMDEEVDDDYSMTLPSMVLAESQSDESPLRYINTPVKYEERWLQSIFDNPVSEIVGDNSIEIPSSLQNESVNDVSLYQTSSTLLKDEENLEHMNTTAIFPTSEQNESYSTTKTSTLQSKKTKRKRRLWASKKELRKAFLVKVIDENNKTVESEDVFYRCELGADQFGIDFQQPINQAQENDMPMRMQEKVTEATTDIDAVSEQPINRTQNMDQPITMQQEINEATEDEEIHQKPSATEAETFEVVDNENSDFNQTSLTEKDMHHPLPPVTCLHCKKTYKSADDFLLHVTKCFLLGKTVTKEQLLFLKKNLLDVQYNQQKRMEEKRSRKSDCTSQKKGILTLIPGSSNSKTPVKRKSVKREYMCESCNFCTTNVDDFLNHIKECLLEMSNEMESSINLEALRRQLVFLRKTYRFEMNKDDVKHICQKQRRLSVFRKRRGTSKPKKTTQSTQKPSIFLCSFCSKTFPRRSSLRVHEKYVHGEWKHFCQVCGKSFPTKSNRMHHEKAVHAVSLDYQCQLCGSLFKDAYSLKKHELLEKGIAVAMKYRCEVCNLQFRTKPNYERHIQTHYITGKYKCSKCYRNFAKQWHLASHERTHVRQLECDQCGRTFSQQRLLTWHKQRSHGVAGRRKCHLCHLTFFSYANLTKHLELEHASSLLIHQ